MSSARRAIAASPVKQWNTPRTPPLSFRRANVSSVASRVWMMTGAIQFAGQSELRREHLLLHVARREIVVVVEPDLANAAGGESRRVRLVSPRPTARGRPANVPARMRMDARRESHRGPTRAPRPRAREPLPPRRRRRGCTAPRSTRPPSPARSRRPGRRRMPRRRGGSENRSPDPGTRGDFSVERHEHRLPTLGTGREDHAVRRRNRPGFPDPVIDSHCHLADEVFAGDLDGAISRAKEAGFMSALWYPRCGRRGGSGSRPGRGRALARGAIRDGRPSSFGRHVLG